MPGLQSHVQTAHAGASRNKAVEPRLRSDLNKSLGLVLNTPVPKVGRFSVLPLSPTRPLQNMHNLNQVLGGLHQQQDITVTRAPALYIVVAYPTTPSCSQR